MSPIMWHLFGLLIILGSISALNPQIPEFFEPVIQRVLASGGVQEGSGSVSGKTLYASRFKADLFFKPHCDNIKGRTCTVMSNPAAEGSVLLSFVNEAFPPVSDWVRNADPQLEHALIDLNLVNLHDTLRSALIILRKSVFILDTWLETATTATYGACSKFPLMPLCTPHQWSDTDLQRLYPSNLLSTVIQEKKMLKEMYTNLETTLFRNYEHLFQEKVTYSDWVDAFSLARSLTFIRPYDQESVFAPFLITFRHSLDSKVKIQWDQKHFQLIADKDYNEEDEITLNFWQLLGSLETLLDESDLARYGVDSDLYFTTKSATLDTSAMLLNFGDIPRNNYNYTNVILRVKLTFDDLVVEHLLEDFIAKNPIVTNGVAEFRITSNGVPEGFLSVARLMVITLEELLSKEDVLTQIFTPTRIISLENELRATRKVIYLLQKQIEAYPVGMEYIQDLFQNQNVLWPRPFYYAQQLHHLELYVLEHALKSTTDYWNDLLYSHTQL